MGVDPDVCWLDSLPPGWKEGDIDSLMLWLPGHRVPRLAIEIVSRHHPYKDYVRVQDKYAVVGVDELWVYDPRKYGPHALGGPVLLQVWTRTPTGIFVRRHYGDSPVRSELVEAWLVPQAGDHLLIADDAAACRVWPSLHEQEHQRAEQERARAERERARADELEKEIARLREGARRR